MFKDPAVGAIELKSIARGMRSADVMVKRAPIELIKVHPICPGKFFIMIAGEVDPVAEAMKAGCEDAADLMVGEIYLPYAHLGIIPALSGTVNFESVQMQEKSLAIVESFSVAYALKALDLVLKRTDVLALDLRLASGLGGKAYFILIGELPQIESALAISAEFLKSEGSLACAELIRAPHPEFLIKGLAT
ncbi:MAG: BMC domain-containing protein [Oligoflexia bacterium]|nr:BMC domain-containing protein [Oligoflexia bacterium]